MPGLEVARLKEDIRRTVVSMLRVNMGLRPGESVLVVTDYPEASHWASYDAASLEDAVRRALLARAVYEVAREEFGDREVGFLAYPLTGRHGAEPPARVGDEMARHDVVLAITTFSLTHTEARRRATGAGARIASMPGLTADMLAPEGAVSADYGWVSGFSRGLAERLKGARRVRVTTEAGTDLEFSVEGREWGVDDGIYDRPGSWGNLPAGEVYVAPVEGSAEGVVVVERGWYPGLGEDMVLRVRGGEVVRVEGGGEVGDRLRELLGLEPRVDDELHRARRNLAEFGLGTNPKARRPDNVLEAEKILGTAHVAVGDSSHLGGRVEADLHEDFVIPRPTVYVDGRKVVEAGRYLVP